jgi:hypothetical protein
MPTWLSTEWNNFLYIKDTYSAIVAIGFLIIGVVAFGYFFIPKEIRLYRNRRRPIMIFKSKGEPMEVETKLLRDSRLFNIPENPTDQHQYANMIKNHSLVIIGYSPKMKNFKEVLDGVIRAKVPVIIYSQRNIPDNVLKELRKYPWHSICQFPLRLINDTFVILSTFPNNK